MQKLGTNLAMEILNGNDDIIDFEDFLGGDQFEPVDFHAAMEAKLNL